MMRNEESLLLNELPNLDRLIVVERIKKANCKCESSLPSHSSLYFLDSGSTRLISLSSLFAIDWEDVVRLPDSNMEGMRSRASSSKLLTQRLDLSNWGLFSTQKCVLYF
jgi:hypothetical protein